MSREFTDEELRQMERPTMEAAIAAVEAGDQDEATRLIRRMAREFKGLHDTYVSWVSDVMDHIYVNDGEEALYEAMKKAATNYSSRRLTAKATFRQKVERTAAGLRAHNGGLEIEEDDEKVVLKMKPCGSGQWLLESGAYDAPRNLSRVRPHRMTWGLPDFPVYCVHQPISEILAVEKIGRLERYCIPSERVAEESCRFVLVKDPKFVPDEIYQRIGVVKRSQS